jgi:hypothetical protein
MERLERYGGFGIRDEYTGRSRGGYGDAWVSGGAFSRRY